MYQYHIRNGKSEDFDDVLPLIVMAIEDLANQFTNTCDPHLLKERMRSIYNTPGTRFYKGYSVVIEATSADNEVVVSAVGYAYPGHDMRELTSKTIEACKSVGAVYETEQVEKLVNSKEAENDEFYIDNLAVYERFRGCGLSKQIIEALEANGEKQGFKKISILADVHNEKGKAIYEKLGYRADCIYHVLGHEYFHLVKNL